MAQLRMRQSMSQIELAFEQEMALEKRRREQLRKRAANRSRARRIQRTESRGRVRFSTSSRKIETSRGAVMPSRTFSPATDST